MNIKKNIAISENGFLFNPTTGDSYSLNPTGVTIVNMLKDNKNLHEIQQTLIEDFEIDATTVEKDLYDFISVLRNHKLIENA